MRRLFVAAALCWTACAATTAPRATTPSPSPSPTTPSPAAAATTPAKPFWLEVIATTDTHGHLDATPAETKTPDGPLTVRRGGAALLSGYVAAVRRSNPGHVLLIDGGDLFTGTLASDLTEGQAVIDSMNALGYDAAAVGNHEFDFGPVGPAVTPEAPGDDPRGALRQRAAAARFPLLSANLVETQGSKWSSAFTIKTIDGAKVAIVGGSTDATRATTVADNLVGLQLNRLRDATAAAVREARAAGAAVVVVTVHAGSDCRSNRSLDETSRDDLSRCDPDSELFGLVEHLAKDPATKPNLVIGGHTHKALTAVVAGVPVVQAEPKGRGFAVAAIEVGGGAATGRFRIEPSTYLCSHQVEGSSGCPHSPPSTARWVPAQFRGQPIVPDPAVVAAVTPHLQRARALADQPLGARTSGKLDAIYAHESALGNLVADTLRAAGRADIGVMNGGGIRGDLPAGEVTFGRAFEVLPFHNRLAVVGMKGAQIRRLVGANLRTDRGILSLSGLAVEARCSEGKPAVELRTSDGKPLDDQRVYRIATVDFLVKGGDDFSELEPLSALREKAPLVRDLLIEELKRRKVIDPASLYDKRAPRIRIDGRRPLRCAATP